jgi:hypothetical protein
MRSRSLASCLEMRKLTAVLSLFLLTGLYALATPSKQEFSITSADIQDGYVIKKVWLSNYAIPQVSLSDVTFTPAGATASAGLHLADPSAFDIVLGKERKRPFAFVRIPAYSKSIASGSLQQMASFTLTVDEPQTSEPIGYQAKTTAASSVLASGSWYKISITDRGVYKIDYDFLKNKLGVNPDNINPALIRVYGNGGEMMSESNAVAKPDDLVENAIQVFDGGDGAFNQGDYFLFYANGPMKWVPDATNKRFSHVKNLYEDKSYYFLNFDLGIGKRIENQSGNLTSNVTVSDFNYYAVHEEDIINVGKFGKEWWGEEFSTEPGKVNSRTFDFNLGNGASVNDSVRVRLYLGSKCTSSGNNFSVSMNSQIIGNYYLGAVGVDEEADPVSTQYSEYKLPVSNTASFIVNYNPGASTGRGYLNYIELNARRGLYFVGGQLSFRDINSVGPGKVASFGLSNAGSNVQVWDVTDGLQPVKMNGAVSGNQYVVKQDASSLHEFIAMDGSEYLSPDYVGGVDNQNLHGSDQVDFIIITHPDFKAAADKLADFHRQKDGMRVAVATTTQVFNEFGSGAHDIGAIRDYARMFYTRAGLDTTEMPSYMLLLGDASYDYKDRIAGNTNYVPTYETAQSIQVITGYCSDDYFSFLDDNEDIENTDIANTMDIGVGRLPVHTSAEADAVVNKIINYASPASLGPWRISTTVVGDNGDGEVHFDDGEIMASTINDHSDLYNETKVYIAAFPLVSTPGGARAPEANKTINDQIFKGTFLMNYNGHGSTQTLAHERILTQDDFNNWKNFDKLPIMVTATCEFSRYDNPDYVSAGERLILKSDGGAIALLTTTQLVYQYLNRTINVNFLNTQFSQDNGKWLTLGDAFRRSKNITYATPQSAWTLANFRKFALLGDPALTPAFPKHRVATDQILDGNTNEPVDSVKALGSYVIKGSVKDQSGQKLEDFNGRVYVTIYDKPKTASTLNAPIRTFQVQNNIIYKGKATVTNGSFSFAFIAPKDLNYDFGKGKISYYVEDGTTDGAGADTGVVVGGFSDNPIIDDDAPLVKPFINDSLFQDGGITGPNTLLYVQLSDRTGINVSGNSVGHDLTAILDDNTQSPYILNDYYETAPNDYTHGYVNFPVTGLSEGRHSLTVKAWDMNNNSGEGKIYFEVFNGNVMQVRNLMNYPNPFTDITHFVFEHNHPEEALNVQINIYSTSGYLVRTITRSYTPGGSRSNEIDWDGTDNNGAKLSAGVYVYRINIATTKGIQAQAYQKLVLVR